MIPDKDEFIVVATDGLWEVFSSQECIDFIHYKLQDFYVTKQKHQESEQQAMKKSQSIPDSDIQVSKPHHISLTDEVKKELAKSLGIEAYKRGSTDNITIIIKWI